MHLFLRKRRGVYCNLFRGILGITEMTKFFHSVNLKRSSIESGVNCVRSVRLISKKTSTPPIAKSALIDSKPSLKS